MMTTPRWHAEVRKMRSLFPHVKPYAIPGRDAGFRGCFAGPRTRVSYVVMVNSRIADYPENEPGVYIHPHPEPHHWYRDDRLCYQRKEHVWNPAEDTFAQALLLAVKYIAEFDGT
jgi:hypothetical protein